MFSHLSLQRQRVVEFNFFPYIIFLLAPHLRQENPSSHSSAAAVTGIGSLLWFCWNRWQSLGTQCCPAPHVSSPQAGGAHKPEPFPGRHLAPAKISPSFWINRALQGYQYLWINVFEGREGAFIMISSAQHRLCNSSSPPAAQPFHQCLEAVQTKPHLLSISTVVWVLGSMP